MIASFGLFLLAAMFIIIRSSKSPIHAEFYEEIFKAIANRKNIVEFNKKFIYYGQ